MGWIVYKLRVKDKKNMRTFSTLYKELTGVFPEVKAKDASTDLSVDGTDWSAINIDDLLWGWIQALLDFVGQTPNGQAEVFDNSQIFNAMREAFLTVEKGLNLVVLTEYTTSVVPAINANSVIEIDGVRYTNPSEVAITGATVNSTWYDILLTPSGTTFTASFIARGTGVWSDSKQGLYDGNNRVVAIVYRDGSGNFINKNILNVINRTIEIKMEIGDWDMDATTIVTPLHGFSGASKIRGLDVIIRTDDSTTHYSFNSFGVVSPENFSQSIIFTSTGVQLTRDLDGFFDGIGFDSISFNRGWIIITYEV